MSQDLLRVENLSVCYGPVQALDKLSFTLNPGRCLALLGANGAGKSSALRAMAGLIPASGGRILWQGQPLQALSPSQRLRQGLALSPEGRRIFAGLTVEENLRLGAYTLRDSALLRQRLEQTWQRFPRLAERRRQPGGSLSGGEQQLLALARALMSGPRLLMLDEPSLGLAPVMVEQIAALLSQLRDEGLPLLLVEQNSRLALSLAEQGCVLENGRTVAQGDAAALRQDSRVIRAYLGA